MKAGDPVVLHYMARKIGGPIKTKPIFGGDETEQLKCSEGGEFVIACQPKRTDTGPDLQATGEAWLVGCEQCKDTELWKNSDTKNNPSIKADAIPQQLIDEMKQHKLDLTS